MCYSPLCIHSRSLDEELTTGLEDSTHKTGEDEAEDEDVDIEGDKDDSRNEEDMQVNLLFSYLTVLFVQILNILLT
jgi:hypothetical protein